MKKILKLQYLVPLFLILILIIMMLFKKSFRETELAEGIYTLSNKEDAILLEEEKASFQFLWDQTNNDPESPGYGLVRDRKTNPRMSSVASIGYALAGSCIGVENQWITKEEGYERALGTLKTLLNQAENDHGFFYHFLDMNTAKRYEKVEVSVIDTAICINGALLAGEYYQGEIKELADSLYQRIDWDWYRNGLTNQFYMEYKPEVGYHTGTWGIYAEQLMLYFLGAASPTYPVPGNMIYDINLQSNLWLGIPKFIQSPANSIFTYQYSHAWFDLRNMVDNNGYDWYSNSVAATLQARQFCIDTSSVFKTFNSNSWGLTASDGPRGYSGAYGANLTNANDGTIPPCGAIGSIAFTPSYVIDAMNYFTTINGLTGQYGFYDSYNNEGETTKIMKDYLGIDKGISLIMIENYRSGFIWNYMSKNEHVQRGLKLAGFTPANIRMIDDGDNIQNHEGFVGDGITISSTDQAKDGILANMLTFDGSKTSYTLSATLKPYELPEPLAETITFASLGKAKIKASIFDSKNQLVGESNEIKLSSNSYKEYTLDLSAIASKSKNYYRIDFTITPEDEVLILDELRFEGTKNMVRNVMLGERPYVGSELPVFFDYLSQDDLQNKESSYFTYQWQISTSAQKDFIDIEGANNPTYTPTTDDIGKFLRVIVTPVDRKGNPVGLSETSVNRFSVLESMPSATEENLWKAEASKAK